MLCDGATIKSLSRTRNLLSRPLYSRNRHLQQHQTDERVGQRQSRPFARSSGFRHGGATVSSEVPLKCGDSVATHQSPGGHSKINLQCKLSAELQCNFKLHFAVSLPSRSRIAVPCFAAAAGLLRSPLHNLGYFFLLFAVMCVAGMERDAEVVFSCLDFALVVGGVDVVTARSQARWHHAAE